MNMLPYLKANLDTLAAAKSPLGPWLGQAQVDIRILEQKLFKNRWGHLDWKMDNGSGMFEASPPPLFYKSWVPDKKFAHLSITYLIGCNIGYGLNHILRNSPRSHKVVVLEPDPVMLLACLSQTDYSQHINGKKLIFLPPDMGFLTAAVQQAEIQFLFGRIHLRLDIPSQQLSPKYSYWNRKAKDLLENFAVELTTLRNKQDVMVGNELSNFQRALHDGSIKSLKDTAKGMSAVILGAGPSLAQYAPALAKNPPDALICTALQSLPAVQRVGIKPHLAMALDYSRGMHAVFKNLDREWAKDIPLLYSTKLNPNVLRRYPGPTLPIWTKGGLATYIMRGHEMILDAGGNVSVTLFRFLQWCGVNGILLVGQDFAWKGDHSHAEGHHAHNASTEGKATLKDVNGETLQSSMPYIAALRDMERDIAISKFPVYQLYGGGAVIKGAQHIQESEVHKLVDSEPERVNFFLNAVDRARRPLQPPEYESKSQHWNAMLRSAQKKLEKLFKKPDKNRQEIWNVFKEAHGILRREPLYLPYLFNEVMNVGKLLNPGPKYEYEDFTSFKQVVKSAQTKSRQVENAVCFGNNADSDAA